MQQYTDIQLVENIRQGDLKSFEQVFNAYAENLVRYAETILKNTYEAEDIVQQLFVQLWDKRSTLVITTSLKSYLYRAAHNSSLNKIKQHGVRDSYAEYYTYVGNAETGSAAQRVEAKEVNTAIETAIEELPEQCRKVFRLSRFEQMKYQQIADELGISVKTVENQMGKALKHMRLRLKDYMLLLMMYLMNQN
ncbi:MAG: RNA polymerase sigma-70 factor [Bacteroidota bacterium]